MTMSLLPPCPTIPTLQRVQNISFPTRHEPEPDSIPTCKGFALVTLSCLDDVEALLDAWPWDPSSATVLKQDGMENVQPGLPVHENQELTSAKAFGLRICTKARWEELRAEYLLYRQRLVDEINQQQDAEFARRGVREIESKPSEALETRDSQMDHLKRKRSESSTAQTHHEVFGSRFPSGCLVFVRHVHPETNRTTLRTLFSRAWEESSANKDVIHYIDYGKNMDSVWTFSALNFGILLIIVKLPVLRPSKYTCPRRTVCELLFQSPRHTVVRSGQRRIRRFVPRRQHSVVKAHLTRACPRKTRRGILGKSSREIAEASNGEVAKDHERRRGGRSRRNWLRKQGKVQESESLLANHKLYIITYSLHILISFLLNASFRLLSTEY